MVEFALVLPVFLLVVMATIDFSGYFGVRLSAENAARAGARVAVVNPTSGSAIATAVEGAADFAIVPNNVDCSWNGTSLAPSSYPPFALPSGKTACIGIWYFELNAYGSPSLCAQWSVQNSYWDTWSGSTESTDQSSLPSTCYSSLQNIAVVGVGYTYSPFTPVPALPSSALTTYGETQLLIEQ